MNIERRGESSEAKCRGMRDLELPAHTLVISNGTALFRGEEIAIVMKTEIVMVSISVCQASRLDLSQHDSFVFERRNSISMLLTCPTSTTKWFKRGHVISCI